MAGVAVSERREADCAGGLRDVTRRRGGAEEFRYVKQQIYSVGKIRADLRCGCGGVSYHAIDGKPIRRRHDDGHCDLGML